MATFRIYTTGSAFRMEDRDNGGDRWYSKKKEYVLSQENGNITLAFGATIIIDAVPFANIQNSTGTAATSASAAITTLQNAITS